MQDRRTHGKLTNGPPAQTYCGLPTHGRHVTTDPFRVDCGDCISLMRMVGEMPDLSEPMPQRGRGRPRKRRLFGL
jgi:hypothetical protein